MILDQHFVLDDYFQKFIIQKMKYNKEKVPSYHEAGHAFAGIYFGIPPFNASIIPEEDCLGFVAPGYTRMIDQVDFGKYQIIDNNYDIDFYLLNENIRIEVDTLTFILVCTYSGVVSELIYSGKYNKVGFSSDYKNIFHRLFEYGKIEIEEEKLQCYADYTMRIIKDNWSNIIILAEDLFQEKMLNAA